MKTQFKKSGISYYLIIIKSYMVFMMIAKKILLAPHGALVVIALSHLYTAKFSKIFSSNLSKPMSKGGIN